jgi:hypothetical protein
MAKKVTKVRSKSASAKTVAKKNSSSRVRRATKSQIKQKNKKTVHSKRPIPGSFKLTWHSFSFLKKNWKPLGGIVLVYGLLNLFLAGGIVSNANSAVSNFQGSRFSDALSSFSSIVSGGSGQTASMQSILLVIESLVIIWALRHLFSGEKIGVKQAYYHASGPLIQFIIIIFVIILQLLPITIGSVVLAVVLSSIIGNGLVEAIFTFAFALLSFWSVYMVCSSIFALYIVTLPNMQPRAALKSAKNLVHFRRWFVLRRLLFLPLFIIVFMGFFLVPLILYAKFLVTPTFFILSMLTVLFTHTYLYSLYKGLLE